MLPYLPNDDHTAGQLFICHTWENKHFHLILVAVIVVSSNGSSKSTVSKWPLESISAPALTFCYNH